MNFYIALLKSRINKLRFQALTQWLRWRYPGLTDIQVRTIAYKEITKK